MIWMGRGEAQTQPDASHEPTVQFGVDLVPGAIHYVDHRGGLDGCE